MPPSFSFFKSKKKAGSAANGAGGDAASVGTAPNNAAGPRGSMDGAGSVAGKSTTSKLKKANKKKNSLSISQSIAPTPTAEEVEYDYGNEKVHQIPFEGEHGEHGVGLVRSVHSVHHPSLPVIRSIAGSRRAKSPYPEEDEDDFVLVHPHRAPSAGGPQPAFMSMSNAGGSQYARSTSRQVHPEIYDDPLMFPPTYPSQPTRYEPGLRYPKFVSSITGTPVVSQYIQPGDPHHHPPPPPPMPEIPSRSWSPIPSVEREESPRDEAPGAGGDQSWVNYEEPGHHDHHHESHPGGLLLSPDHLIGDPSDLRISTMAEGGQRGSVATLEYVDPPAASPHQIVSRPLASHPSLSRSQHAGTHREPSIYGNGNGAAGEGQALVLSRPLPSNHSGAQSHIFVPPHDAGSANGGSQTGSFEHPHRVSSPRTILPRKPLQSHPSQSRSAHSHSHSHSHSQGQAPHQAMHDPEHPSTPHPGVQHTLPSSHSIARSHVTGHASQAPNGFEYHDEFGHPYPHEEEAHHHHVLPSNHSIARSHATTRAPSQMHHDHDMEYQYEGAPSLHAAPSHRSVARSHATGAPSQGHEQVHSVHVLPSNRSVARSHVTGAPSQGGHDQGEQHHVLPSNHSIANRSVANHSIARSHATGAASHGHGHGHGQEQEHPPPTPVLPSNHSIAAKSQRTAHGSNHGTKSSDHLSVAAHSNIVVPSKPISSQQSLGVPSRAASMASKKSKGSTVHTNTNNNKGKENQSQISRSIVYSPSITGGRGPGRGRSVSTARSVSVSRDRDRDRSRSPSPFYGYDAASRRSRMSRMTRRRSSSSGTRSSPSPVRSRARTASMRQPPPAASVRSGYAKPHSLAPPSIVQLTDRPSRHTNSGSWGDTTPIEPQRQVARRVLAPSAIEPGIVEQEYWDEKEVVLEIYHYIVPTGVKVMFQDQEGNMILRMAKTGQILASKPVPQKCAPIVVHDAHGRELYRSTDIRGPSPTAGDIRGGKFERRHDSPASGHKTKTIMIDETGKEIVLKE